MVLAAYKPRGSRQSVAGGRRGRRLGLGGTIDNPVTGKIIIHLLFHFVKYDKNSLFSNDHEFDP